MWLNYPICSVHMKLLNTYWTYITMCENAVYPKQAAIINVDKNYLDGHQ